MRNRYLLLADVALVGVAALAAFLLRFDWNFMRTRTEFLPFLLTAIVVKPMTFFAFGLYRRLWRYATLQDAQRTLLAAGCAAVAVGFVVVARAPLRRGGGAPPGRG